MNPHRSSRALGLAFTAAITLAAAARAQTPAPNLPPSSATISTSTAPQLSDAQLETLLGPVALYPDALIALILPAATAPSDVVLAARFLAVNRDELQLENQPWDESVRSLARYPDVIKWMDENLSWTKQVGEAFLAQPADVMQAVQRLRARARAAGTLVDTPEQKIVTEGEVILIEPAQPNIIYVPRYDPEIVYYTRVSGWSQPYVTFGLGFAIGSWLTYDCDWPGRTIWVGNWRHRPQNVWVRPAFPNRPLHPGATLVVAQPWRPPSHRYQPPRVITGPRPQPVVIYPRPMPGTPPRPPGFERPRHSDSDHSSRPGNRPDDNRDRRRDPTPPPSRIVNPPAAAPATMMPPPVAVMPPPTTIGAPPPDRRRERPTPSPDSPRRDAPRSDVGRPESPRNDPPRAQRPSDDSRRESRPSNSNNDRRESRPSSPAPSPSSSGGAGPSGRSNPPPAPPSSPPTRTTADPATTDVNPR